MIDFQKKFMICGKLESPLYSLMYQDLGIILDFFVFLFLDWVDMDNKSELFQL